MAVVVTATTAPASHGPAAELPIDPELEFPLGIHLIRHPVPAGEAVPAALHLGGKIRKEYGLVPELRELRLEGDRHVRLNVAGLPACGLGKLPTQPPPSQRCADAIVGRGFAVVQSQFPENMPMNIPMDLTVYNAGIRSGVTRLWIYAYISSIEPGPIYVPVTIRKLGDGRYGWEAVAPVPSIFDGNGSITEFNLTLQRRIVSAICPGDTLFAASRSTFSDGTVLGLKYQQRCR